MQRLNDVNIRAENSASAEELSAIHAINEAAFGGPEEAVLVDRLRNDGHVLVSLVAEIGGDLAGHSLFSRMWIDTPDKSIPAVALAPMAVLPAFQRRGIGGQLIRHGLDVLRSRGEKIVIVVGHPGYYPRYGFSSRLAQALKSPFPAEAFMALELSPDALKGVRGKVTYPAPFSI